MINSKVTSFEWTTWLRWVLFSAGGLFIPYLLAGLFIPPTGGALNNVFTTVLVFLLGAIIGIAQWGVLRSWINRPATWVVASSLGFVIASYAAIPLKLLDIYIGANFEFEMDEVLYGAVFGVVLGSIQWIVLRGHLTRSGWWIAGSMLGWTLGMFIVQIIPFDWNWPGTGLVYETIVMIMASMITGLVLIKCLEIQGGGASIR